MNFENATYMHMPGIYFFKPNLLSLRALGLRGNSNFSEDEIYLANKIFSLNIEKLCKIYSDRKITGILFEKDKDNSCSLAIDLDGSIKVMSNNKIGKFHSLEIIE